MQDALAIICHRTDLTSPVRQLDWSPNLPNEEHRLREEGEWQPILEHRESLLYKRFDAQSHKEYRQLFKLSPGSGYADDDNLSKLGRETIKNT